MRLQRGGVPITVGNKMVTNQIEDQVFSALAHRTRRDIVRSLADQPRPVHKIADEFSVTRPAVSRHLRILREAGLVGVSASGRENLYYLKSSTLKELEDWLTSVWQRRLNKLKTLAEENPDDR